MPNSKNRTYCSVFGCMKNKPSNPELSFFMIPNEHERSGYKYRTLSTNTGERKRRDSKEDTEVDRVFKDIRREISTRIDKELDKTDHAREIIFDKFEKIDSKINSMLELQDNVLAMRQTLNNAEMSLLDMVQRVQQIEAYSSDPGSLRSRKSSFRAKDPAGEERVEQEVSNLEAAAVPV